MKCADVEILYCDYLDRTLPDEQRTALEAHVAECESCAAMARDVGGALAFVERSAEVEAPPELLTRILDETRSGRHGRLGGARAGLGGWLARLLAPVLQPRLVMGMALTILSFSMMARCAGVQPRPITVADLDPVKVWATADDRAHRTWDRGVKFYESIRWVYEVRRQLAEWTEQQEEEDRAAAESKPLEERRLKK
ncbi:MAG: anti-sigma factor family protein [Bryobacteraceae bacterium]